MRTGPGDLVKERQKASFIVHDLTTMLYGTRQLEIQAAVQKIIESEPIFTISRKNEHMMSREQVVKINVAKLLRVIQITKERELDPSMAAKLKQEANIGGIGLHDGVFLPNIMGMSSPEQHEAWVQKAKDYQIIGCYAQTEMAHGSNVRGLMTTCTFDGETDEFVVDTPCLEATKWWPGGMGLLANHAVVYARLIVDGTDHGIHNFLVQIRDLETHEPLPGVECGDIGPKWGTNSNDNGYLRFDHVRIPRFNMLAKNAQLDRDGTYHPPKQAKASYATMTRVRANIVSGAAQEVAKAAAIAVRYSAVRRQEPGPQDPSAERQVLDYVSQQWRILPAVAASYALHFTGRYMLKMLETMAARLAKGDDTLTGEVHAASCALKSLCTTIAADGIEECRRSTGGYGYLMASGLPALYADYMQSFTPEGDNWLLTQQTSRYLLKVLARPEAAGGGSASYLSDVASLLEARLPDAATAETLCASQDLLMQAFTARAAYLVSTTSKAVRAAAVAGEESEGQGDGAGAAFQSQLVEHYRASRAHGFVVILRSFEDGIRIAEAGRFSALATPLRRLFALFALSFMEKDLGDFVECGYVAPHQAAVVRAAVRHVCSQVRPDAVALCDAWGFSDYSLNSCIGRYDGNVYESLYEAARRNPLNSATVDWGRDEFLKPIISQSTGPATVNAPAHSRL